jgi:hypothetical protein
MTQTTTSTKSRSARRLSAALALGAAALMVVPATGLGATKFGAKLNGQVQPSNSMPAHKCEPNQTQACTRISMEAYGRPNGGHKAPKDGVIDKIRLVAGGPGHFRLQLARANANNETGKIVENGPRIDYEGQPNGWPEPYTVETFNVNEPVEKGDHLAIKAKKTSMLRCSSGGANQLLFQPTLDVGGPFEPADATDGCWLLLEAVYA